MYKYGLLMGCIFLGFSTMPAMADDNLVSVVPATTVPYIHTNIIASGIVTYLQVINNNHTFYISESITAQAPCNGTDEHNQPNTHPRLMIKLLSTGMAPGRGYNSPGVFCYIKTYDIDVSNATVVRSGDINTKVFTLSIPFSVQQGGPLFNGWVPQQCGTDGWFLNKFSIGYTVYCAPN